MIAKFNLEKIFRLVLGAIDENVRSKRKIFFSFLLVSHSPAVKPEKWQNRSLFDKSMELGRMIQL